MEPKDVLDGITTQQKEDITKSAQVPLTHLGFPFSCPWKGFLDFIVRKFIVSQENENCISIFPTFYSFA